MGSFHLFLTLTFGGLNTNFLVILLEGGKILTGFGEFTFFHTLSDVPMDEGSLGVHKIEFVINSGEDLSDGSGVGDHADGSHDLGEITTWHNGRRLVVDTALETSRAPVNELDGSLGLDGGNGGVDILGDDITSVHEATGHVLSVSGVTLGHHGGGLEGGVGDLGNGELLVVGLLGRDDGTVRGKHEMDSGVGDQVSLELGDIDVEGTIESEGCGQRGDNLSDESVKVGVGGSLDIEVSSADIVNGLVIEHNGNIGVLKEGVSGEHGVVWLDDGGGDLGRGVDSESELGFLTVVNGESLEEEGSETGTSTTTNGVEDEETLETSALISELSNSVEAEIDDLLTDGVVTSGEVVSGIFLTGDELLGVEELSVGTSSDLIDNSGLKIEEDSAGNVLASTSLGEEGVESVVTTTDGLIGRHLTIRLNTVLEAEEFPTGVTDLDTSLTDVD
mmetsp:Transcript_35141/g.25614  ORF Transcript_35141/g.25614 Transcript_35141/m.25614 type:complete len:447 (+) Transcript_35141:68-1408(+)